MNQDLSQISQEVTFGIFRNEKIGGSFFNSDSTLSSTSENSRSLKMSDFSKMADFDKKWLILSDVAWQ